MSSVNNVGGSSPVQKLATPALKSATTSAPASTPTRPADRVELSGVSHLISAAKSNDIRHDKVASIKAQIASGTYETDHKLDTAVDRLLDDIKD
jgi:negative regulator of flagellin synthesis FlgM